MGCPIAETVVQFKGWERDLELVRKAVKATDDAIRDASSVLPLCIKLWKVKRISNPSSMSLARLTRLSSMDLRCKVQVFPRALNLALPIDPRTEERFCTVLEEFERGECVGLEILS